MPTKEAMIEQVASQMMKGGRPGRVKASQRQRDAFRTRHEKHIRWAIEHLPRCSAAVHAVIVKCLIKYGEAPVGQFCKSLRSGLFQGATDPVHLLWRFLQRHRGKDTTGVYQRAACAARAYMEGKTLVQLRPIKEDIFAWDEGWTVPDELLAGWNPDSVPAEDQIAVEVEAALQEMRAAP